jgi:hypothetical protein
MQSSTKRSRKIRSLAVQTDHREEGDAVIIPANFLSAPEAAQYLRCSESWLAHQRGTGRGPPFVKWGLRVIYRRSDLDVFMAGQLRLSTAG